MNKDLDSDIEELREQFKSYTKGELCEVLEGYINTVGRERTISTREYKTYIELLTEEIDKKYD